MARRTRCSDAGSVYLVLNRAVGRAALCRKSARRKLRLSGNSLRTVARNLGAAAKRDLEPTVWQRAALDGDRGAMDQIAAHCRRDVRALVEVVSRLKVYCTDLNSWGSGW
jgi:hypothetical protein